MITHVAIKIPGEMLSLPKPYRHHNIISRYHYRTGEMFPEDNEQGFLTDTGIFLNRKRAVSYAIHHNQLKPGTVIRCGQLFSEDIW